jgi:hypothetical protein
MNRMKCACFGCNNYLSDEEVDRGSIYCKKCEGQLVVIEEGDNTCWVYCRQHEEAPTKNERVEFLILTKAYNKRKAYR